MSPTPSSPSQSSSSNPTTTTYSAKNQRSGGAPTGTKQQQWKPHILHTCEDLIQARRRTKTVTENVAKGQNGAPEAEIVSPTKREHANREEIRRKSSSDSAMEQPNKIGSSEERRGKSPTRRADCQKGREDWVSAFVPTISCLPGH